MKNLKTTGLFFGIISVLGVDDVPDCDTMWTHTQIPTFQRNILPTSSGLKTETRSFSKMLVTTLMSTQHHNPEGEHRDLCRKNLKPHTAFWKIEELINNKHFKNVFP
jgi:hypothetical protein